MCSACTEEYTHADTRRYDAQPVCCNDCGPEVYIIGRPERGPAAITYTRKILAAGGIAAIKGIGGFHLCCDASNSKAVARLRQLKHRPVKPFAVMLRDLAAAQRECELTPFQQEILTGHQKPILLLDKKGTGKVTAAAAPGNPKIGIMLPYAPIQLLLFEYPDDIAMPDCLVMTSGNPSGAPICRTDEDALAALGTMCDVFLSHNRKIRLWADDSVMDFHEQKPYMIRRSRGYAPLPVMLRQPLKGEVLAVGGELKNVFCLGHDNLFYPSPYIGDLSDLRTVQALKESIQRMETLLETTPTLVACDLHPRYNSTQIAHTLGLPVLPIQHHYAHIVSCMAENDFSEPCIGVAFDGTGYGPDGTIWGGEFLRADLSGFTRIGSIQPFLQAGGDRSSLDGWRIAVALLYAACKDRSTLQQLNQQLNLCTMQALAAQCFMADQHINCIQSTSAGRIFDAVSALLGICRSSTFEGEASMKLQYAAEAWLKKQAAPRKQTLTVELLYPQDRLGCFELPTAQLFQSLLEARLAGQDVGALAYRFHSTLADQILAGCMEMQRQTNLSTIALSGGVFQNQLLLSLCCDRLRTAGFQLLLHSLIPPNDGGISLGQAVAAMQQLNLKSKS